MHRRTNPDDLPEGVVRIHPELDYLTEGELRMREVRTDIDHHGSPTFTVKVKGTPEEVAHIADCADGLDLPHVRFVDNGLTHLTLKLDWRGYVSDRDSHYFTPPDRYIAPIDQFVIPDQLIDELVHVDAHIGPDPRDAPVIPLPVSYQPELL